VTIVTIFFLSLWIYLWLADTSQPADQPNYLVEGYPPIVTIVTIFFLSLWIYLWLADTSQPADQPNNLAEGHFPL
jgi:nitrogen fixation-related uncharacterized protein